jgi:hypothetical protein
MRTGRVSFLILIAAATTLPLLAQTRPPQPPPPAPAVATLAATLDKVADKWVEDTLKKMTLDDKVGQLIVSGWIRRIWRQTRTSSSASRRRSARCASAITSSAA